MGTHQERTGARKCQRCTRAATMAATNVNVQGQWYFCTRCMGAAVKRDQSACRNTFQYRWPIFGDACATDAQRALRRDASGVSR